MHSAKVIADSISEFSRRLTTLEVVMPRIILAEFNTHRLFSRNSASSRAIPIEKMIRMVMDNPYIPSEWARNQKGMQAGAPLNEVEAMFAREHWLDARDAAVLHAEKMLAGGIHKQWTNRLLEPFMWHTVVVTATEWDNFFHLRCHPDAHPDIQLVANLMRQAIEGSTPKVLTLKGWHLPYTTTDDDYFSPETLRSISTGRCARVSYLTHDGVRDPNKDVGLHDSLLNNGHMSPFEHIARPMTSDEFGAEHLKSNFVGWVQYRKLIPAEHDRLNPAYEKYRKRD